LPQWTNLFFESGRQPRLGISKRGFMVEYLINIGPSSSNPTFWIFVRAGS
jgi:hypothetical protein